jgi:hypothetical protein
VSVFCGGVWHRPGADASRYPQEKDETGGLSTGGGRVWEVSTRVGTLDV